MASVLFSDSQWKAASVRRRWNGGATNRMQAVRRCRRCVGKRAVVRRRGSRAPSRRPICAARSGNRRRRRGSALHRLRHRWWPHSVRLKRCPAPRCSVGKCRLRNRGQRSLIRASGAPRRRVRKSSVAAVSRTWCRTAVRCALPKCVAKIAPNRRSSHRNGSSVVKCAMCSARYRARCRVLSGLPPRRLRPVPCLRPCRSAKCRDRLRKSACRRRNRRLPSPLLRHAPNHRASRCIRGAVSPRIAVTRNTNGVENVFQKRQEARFRAS